MLNFMYLLKVLSKTAECTKRKETGGRPSSTTNSPDMRQIHRSSSDKLSEYLIISRVIARVFSSGKLLRAARATTSEELLLVASARATVSIVLLLVVMVT